jgi:hypothetical protein
VKVATAGNTAESGASLSVVTLFVFPPGFPSNAAADSQIPARYSTRVRLQKRRNFTLIVLGKLTENIGDMQKGY